MRINTASIAAAISLIAAVSFAETKESDLAGNWYPSSPAVLKNMLQGYLDKADPGNAEAHPFALISPHAGYQFSGPVAAYGFKLAMGQEIKTVIIIGFSHKKFFDGISIYDKGAWKTPLGSVPIDETLAKAIRSSNARIGFEPDLFESENSVEMQIPFVQTVFKDARIVPIVFGTQDYRDAEMLSDALINAIKGRTDCLIVASTDLSHYHPYEEANSIDRHTIALLSQMKARQLYNEAGMNISELCGIMPVVTTMLAAEKLGFNKIKVLKYANSGDTFGDKNGVVGYLSAVIYGGDHQPTGVSEAASGYSETYQQKEKEQGMLNDAQKKRLLQIARESITAFVRDGKRKIFQEEDPILSANMGAFVTLHENGELRGCIGNMVSGGPLYKTIADMAIEAAAGDPRFHPLSANEIDRVDIEISVLSPMKKVASHNEVRIPGHGVLIKRGFRSGVYLPQVASETGWGKEEFLNSLCGHKAGMAQDAWKDPGTDIYVFSAEVFGEKETRK